eukprot:353248-Chlamydomonas_euryale.AAC.4
MPTRVYGSGGSSVPSEGGALRKACLLRVTAPAEEPLPAPGAHRPLPRRMRIGHAVGMVSTPSSCPVGAEHSRISDGERRGPRALKVKSLGISSIFTDSSWASCQVGELDTARLAQARTSRGRPPVSREMVMSRVEPSSSRQLRLSDML